MMHITKKVSIIEDELKAIVGKYIEENAKESIGAYKDLKIKFGNGSTHEEVAFTTIKFEWTEYVEE